MIDTHAHLDDRSYDSDRDQVIERATSAGVCAIIAIATDFDSCERVLRLAEAHSQIFAALGVHPHDAKTWDGDKSADRLKHLGQHPKVVAFGEIGLDYFRDHSPRDAQRRAFVDQIAVARELDLPTVIHNRDAFDDIIELMENVGPPTRGGVFHCFTGTPEQAQRCFDLGFCISLNGVLTYKNSSMMPVAETAPLERILLETDCPYLTPHPFRGKRNEPAYVQHVAEKLAEIRGQTVPEIETATDANARRLFGFPPTA